MTDIVWLASYPKSGNTWFRMLVAALSATDDHPLDINDLPEGGGIASARPMFDNILMIESGLLTHDEVDRLRPRLHEAIALENGEPDDEGPSSVSRFSKVHDAYGLTPAGEPLLAGRKGAKSAIVIVRDPRDVASSLANHNSSTLDQAIAFMNNLDAAYCDNVRRQHGQLRQRLAGWSGHIASWLDQRDIPVHLVRYEDLKANTAQVFQAAMAFAGRAISPEDAGRAVDLAGFSKLQAQEQEKGFREWRDSKPERNFFRRGESGGWRDELTAEQVAQIEIQHAPMMARLGYELSVPAAMAGMG